MAKINIEGINLYAYHGCLKEESIIGGNYIVDISINTNLSAPARSDNLNETIDYCDVYTIVKDEMVIPSKLIEHVAQRIYDHLKKKYPSTQCIEVKVTKLNPPISGDVEKVSIVISE